MKKIIDSIYAFFSTITFLLFTAKKNILKYGYIYIKYKQLSSSYLISLLGKYLQKRTTTVSLSGKIKYTWYISHIHDLLYERKTKTTATSYDKLLHHIQSGDLLFFLGGKSQQRYDKLLQSISEIPTRHVGIVGEKTPFNFYHSTIKRYETGRNGVHEVDLKEELLSRGKNLVILVVRPFKDKVFTTAVVNAAKKFKREQLKYSTIDALSSALGMGCSLDGKNMNCGDFVHKCLLSIPYYIPIPNPGIPCNLLKGNHFSFEYITTL